MSDVGMTDTNAMREALEWYAEQVAGCRKIGSAGDLFRHTLDRDGGERARNALALLATDRAAGVGEIDRAEEIAAKVYASYPFPTDDDISPSVMADFGARCILAVPPPAPADASGEVERKAITWVDVLREWFGGERYARDYEYLDANYRKNAERVADYSAALNPTAGAK